MAKDKRGAAGAESAKAGKLSSKGYETELARLQVELAHLQA